MRNFILISGLIVLLTACRQGKKEQKNQSDPTMDMDTNSLVVKLEQVWETDTSQLITPECATYDPERKVLYISNLNRDNEEENDGYISIVNPDGGIKNARWIEGLGSPLGNDIYNDFLYVNDNGNIVKINIQNGEIVEKINVEGASDLNGMDIDKNGNIYSADSDGNKIFKVTQDKEVTLLFEGEALNEPNGVLFKDGKLIVASFSDNSLLSLNLKDKSITTLVEGIGKVDGIISLEQGHYFTSSWSGEIYFISSDMNEQKILDTSSEKINAADIGYIPQDSILVVPTFFDNRLVAYKVVMDDNNKD